MSGIMVDRVAQHFGVCPSEVQNAIRAWNQGDHAPLRRFGAERPADLWDVVPYRGQHLGRAQPNRAHPEVW